MVRLRARFAFVTLWVAGCQAVLGIEDTTESSNGSGAGGAVDGGSGGQSGDASVGGSGGSAGSDAEACDGPSEGFSIVAPTQKFYLPRGAVTAIPASVVRDPCFTGVIELDIEPITNGIGSTPDSLASPETSGAIQLDVPVAAPTGLVSTKLTASSGGVSHDVDLTLVITEGPGVLDTGFGAGGLVLVTPSDLEGRALVAHANGSIYVAASNATTPWKGVKIDDDGTVDTAWDPPRPINSTVIDIALAANGMLVLGGQNDTPVLSRVNPTDGAFDPSFNTGYFDMAKTATPSGSGSVTSIAVMDDGKIAVTALELPATGFLTRVTEDGKQDTLGAFGSKTVAGRVESVAAQGPKIVAGGYENQDFYALRLVSDGAFDPTFGTGEVTLDVTLERAYTIAIEPDGAVVLGGDSHPAANLLALARFQNNGSPDPAFGAPGSGMETYQQPDVTSSLAKSLVLDEQGRIIVAAVGNAQSTPVSAVMRVNHDGTLDQTFGEQGWVVLGTNFVVHDIARDTLGRYVVTGKNPLGTFVMRIWP